MTPTPKNTQICACGCAQYGTPNRMIFVRQNWRDETGSVRPGRMSWLVLKECREQFEVELLHLHALEDLSREAGRGNWWRRLMLAPRIYDTQMAIHRRRKGEKRAARLASFSVKMLLLPRWLAMRVKEPVTK